MNAIMFALYLPDTKKRYVIQEIFDYIKIKEKNAKVFIGIQTNSIPETEEIIRKIKGKVDVISKRVPESMLIDSDASSFMSALELYSESDMNFDWCYFIHSKGITSNNDQLRRMMYQYIFDKPMIQHKFEDPLVGSYSPFLTITDVQEDIDKMHCMYRFNPEILTHSVMEYYYINTFYVIKNVVLKNFISTVSSDFFNTPLQTYSDRYMFERDFSHIVDMQGYIASFGEFHGNYSTNYQPPTMDKYQQKYSKWYKENS